MLEQYYEEAKKSANKEYRACVARGEYPYLSVLDDILPEQLRAQGRSVGIVQIPAEFIVGTKSHGRTEAFARNFMPLLDEKSEFAIKWKSLCSAHLEEGIRDPVKVYEYLNRYYVEEGNKRVSVLKFFDAVNISAQVIRILPEQTPENELYFEFLAFSRCSGINFLEFSKKESYTLFQRLLGKTPNEEWTDTDRRRFISDYFYFRSAYEARAGGKLRSTIGDAMLSFIQVYGYPAIRSMSSAELKKAIGSVWEEMVVQQFSDPIVVKTEPEETKPGLLSHLIPAAIPKRRKVAFLHDRNPLVSGWTRGHENGRLHVQRVFDGKIETCSYMDTMAGDPYQTITEAIGSGADVIFTTSPRLLPESLRAAVEHPNVMILNCSLNTSHRYIRTYYARMFEAKFIIGTVAGALSESGNVGYICDYPIWGQIAGINAFALGVQMVRPKAKVFLEWSSVGSKDAAQHRLLEKGIHIISSQDIARLSSSSHSFGLARIDADGAVQLAAPIWNWGVYYEQILRNILNKGFQKDYEASTRALNYYWGMAAGVVTLDFSDRVPESVQKMANTLKDGICAGVVHPFRGPIYDQNAEVKCSGEHTLSLENIINMDYLVENVVGAIPAYHELSPLGRSTVDFVGVQPAKMPNDTAALEK